MATPPDSESSSAATETKIELSGTESTHVLKLAPDGGDDFDDDDDGRGREEDCATPEMQGNEQDEEEEYNSKSKGWKKK